MAGAFVQVWINSSNSNVITVAPNAGNHLTLVSRTSSGSGTPTITGAVTNGSTALTNIVATYQSAGGDWFTVMELRNVPSGTTSITVTYSGGTPGSCGLLAIECSGLATSSTLIANSAGNFQAAPGTGADVITSGSATNITSQPAYMLGIIGNYGNSDTTAGTGWTNRFGTGTSNDWCVIDKRVTSTGNQQVLATAPSHGNTDNYDTFLVAYAEPGGDTTAPSLTSGPTVEAITGSGFNVKGTSDENGTAYLIVTDYGAAQPSDAEFDAATETASMTAGVEFTINHTG